MGEVKDDERSFTIGLITGELVIINFTPTPDPAQEGNEISVDVTFKNNGSDCKYKIKLVDVEGSKQLGFDNAPGYVIDEEPNTYLIGDTIRNGETKTKTVDTAWGIKPCAMPNKAWKLRVEAWRET